MNIVEKNALMPITDVCNASVSLPHNVIDFTASECFQMSPCSAFGPRPGRKVFDKRQLLVATLHAMGANIGPLLGPEREARSDGGGSR